MSKRLAPNKRAASLPSENQESSIGVEDSVKRARGSATVAKAGSTFPDQQDGARNSAIDEEDCFNVETTAPAPAKEPAVVWSTPRRGPSEASLPLATSTDQTAVRGTAVPKTSLAGCCCAVGHFSAALFTAAVLSVGHTRFLFCFNVTFSLCFKMLPSILYFFHSSTILLHQCFCCLSSFRDNILYFVDNKGVIRVVVSWNANS